MSTPIDRSGIPPMTELSEQYVQNLSFDPEFNILTVQLVAWDRASNSLRRVELVESSTTPGHYVLAVGNVDGTPISGGGGGTTTSTYGSGTYGTATYA